MFDSLFNVPYSALIDFHPKQPELHSGKYTNKMTGDNPFSLVKRFFISLEPRQPTGKILDSLHSQIPQYSKNTIVGVSKQSFKTALRTFTIEFVFCRPAND